jgi:spore germination protein YaaH
MILKYLLPGKTVSVAGPASYWYLKGFPIKQIGQVVNYVIYMTYDLHGEVSVIPPLRERKNPSILATVDTYL